MMNATLRTLCMLGALTFVPAAGFAQQHATDRGSVQLSGSASFTSSSNDEDSERTTSISLNPRVAYFVRPGLAVGADILLGRQSRGDASNSVFGIGPAATFYFGAADATAKPYVTANVQWQKSSAESSFGESDATLTGYGAGAGLLFLLSPSVGITSELFYRSTSIEFEAGDTSGDSWGLAIGVAAFIF